MNDTEMLDLIEHYLWTVKRIESKWCVIGVFKEVVKGDTLREAIKLAMDAQCKWALE